MKLADWARKQGISYRTAHRWFKAGTMPVEVEQMPTGTILVKVSDEPKKTNNIAIYARVSRAIETDG